MWSNQGLALVKQRLDERSYQAGLEALGNALANYSAACEAGRKVGFPHFHGKASQRGDALALAP